MSRRHAVVVGVVFVGVFVGVGACARGNGAVDRTVVVAGAVDVAAIEEVVAGVAGVARIRGLVCDDRGLVVVEGGADGAVAAAVRAAAPKLTSPPQVQRQANTVVVFAVRGGDPVVARAAVERALRPALERLPGVQSVDVKGGRTARRVELDLAALLRNDVTVGEVLAVVGGPATLESLVVKTTSASVSPSTLTTTTKTVPPPSAGDLKLTDIARVGTLPVGEPLRRDGAIEVRVRGSADVAAVVDAAQAVDLGDGVALAVLDDDSVESVDVIVPRGVDKDDVHRAIAAIPGVNVKGDDSAVVIDVDRARAARLGVSVDRIADVVAVALERKVVSRNTEDVEVSLAGVPSTELLSQLIVARSPAGAVRLLDVTTTHVAPARRDRLDREDATRLAVTFDVGVRKNALAALSERLRQFHDHGRGVVVDKDGVSCD